MASLLYEEGGFFYVATILKNKVVVRKFKLLELNRKKCGL
jgi:hypothetical protein